MKKKDLEQWEIAVKTLPEKELRTVMLLHIEGFSETVEWHIAETNKLKAENEELKRLLDNMLVKERQRKKRICEIFY
jgi:regulator of replication initiation timing